MRNVLLETGRKAVLVMKWQITTEPYPNVLWKVELVSNEIGYLAEIPKQSAEVKCEKG